MLLLASLRRISTEFPALLHPRLRRPWLFDAPDIDILNGK